MNLLLVLLLVFSGCAIGINGSPFVERLLNGLHAYNINHACILFGRNPNLANAILGGGSIISKRHILTAAQMLTTDATVFQLGCGGTEISKLVRRHSSLYVAHPEYNSITAENDIGIIFLTNDQEFEFSNTLKAIELPKNVHDLPLVNEQGIIAGFGFTSHLQTEANNDLMYIQNYIVDIHECQLVYQQLLSSHFCAKDAVGPMSSRVCRGDHGTGFYVGPLGHEVLIGITSHFNGLCVPNNLPTAFTSVAKYRDWITKHTGI